MDQDNQKAPQPVQPETPWGRIIRQRRTLDETLSTINGNTKESELARMYITGQIEALDWAIRYLD